MGPIKCPKCGVDVEYHRTFCANGHFIGFPNVRRAEGMAADLDRNYDAALADAAARGAIAQVQRLEIVLKATVATVNVDPKIVRNMALGQNYLSYYNAISQGARKIAEQAFHAHRATVDAKVHTGYGDDVINAALSADGRGLTSYGAITLELREVSIEDRASVMRENAFDFYDRFKLGDRDAVEEPGWRSTWAGRAKLGIAHLAPSVTTGTSDADFPSLILSNGPTKRDDRFMEVHIFHELTRENLEKATLSRPLTTPEEQDDWSFSRNKLTRCRITVVDSFHP